MMHLANKSRPVFEEKVGSEYPHVLDWQMGVYHIGNITFSTLPGQDTVRSYTLQWAKENNWSIFKEGISYNKLPACYVYLELQSLGEEANIAEAVKELDYQTEELDLLEYDAVDALFMAFPAFAKIGIVSGDEKYFNHIWKIYNDLLHLREGINDEVGIWEEPEHLMWRDLHSKAGTKTCGDQKSFWSRGNGWAIMMYAKVLELLPAHHEHRKEFELDFRQMVATLAKIQQEEGYWTSSLLDPDDCECVEEKYFKSDMTEATGTAMFVYGITWGINNGVLDKDPYEQVVLKAWSWLTKRALHPEGQLLYCQPSGNWPCSVNRDNETDFKNHVEAHGVGPFLMAGTEMYKLVSK